MDEARLKSITGELNKLGHAAGRAYGRNPDYRYIQTLEDEASAMLAVPELSSSQRLLSEIFAGAIRRGRDERLAAERSAAEIHRLLGGRIARGVLARLWAGPDQIFSQLLSLERDIRVLVTAAYQERYRVSLKDVVLKRFPEKKARPLAALVDDDMPRAILGYLANYSPERTDVLRRLEKIIWQLPRRERRRIDMQFTASPEAIEEYAAGLSPELALALRHLLEGSWAEFQAYCIAFDLRNRRAWPLAERLIHCTAEERGQIAAAFRGSLDSDLVATLRREVPQGPLNELVQALLRNDEIAILAWRGRCAFASASDEWAGDFIRGNRRREFITAYETKFGAGSLERDIARRYRKRDREILVDLLRHGKVARGKLLWFAMAGFGTDEAALLALLENTDTETRVKAETEFLTVWEERAPWYERLFPRLFADLGTRLWLECAGDNWCDLREFVAEEPGGDAFSRLERRYAHERSGSMLRTLDFFSRDGDVMDEDVAAAREFFGKHIAGGSPSARASFQCDSLVELAETSCSIFRGRKHFVGNSLTTAFAGAGVFMSAFALSVLDVHIAVVMCAVGVTSAILRFALKRLLKGRGYHRDEMLADWGFALVDGTTLYLGRVFRQAAVRTGAGFTSRLGLKTSIARFLRGLREVSAEIEAKTLRELVDEGR